MSTSKAKKQQQKQKEKSNLPEWAGFKGFELKTLNSLDTKGLLICDIIANVPSPISVDCYTKFINRHAKN